jgi:Rieske Fe-S protein
LQDRLEQELWQRAQTQHLPILSRDQSGRQRKKRSNISRRELLNGGAAVAASLVVGAGLGATGKALTQPPASNPGATQQWSTSLVPAGAGDWIAVAKLADLGDQALRFATASIIGYIIRSDGDQGEKPGVIAISAACTHMGCIVQWQDADRKYHCPCHGGLFSEYGKPDAASPKRYHALPRLETRITKNSTGEFIEVRVPKSTGTR